MESVDLTGGAGRRCWEDIGVLDRPIGTPHWLARFLREATWPHSPITPSARRPWLIPVQRFLVAGDGLAL
ncbi:hypothetical protein BKM31_17170 [[Actinomadura] parvosata subsp. kistnae]|uniref:Uncharacterized protein n=1 Tax=[Actinomadura] parvosata subsp. kistnae TaxID=1909395 RepID=A0A1U9ZYE4_9ACTN|nr:hypothetical protein [Nonomuraea sp. ATCC 55076]AQZ62964.1 hypothetical protein BKM31_17170 [Nonomuraea sp. ATCC 55076]